MVEKIVMNGEEAIKQTEEYKEKIHYSIIKEKYQENSIKTKKKENPEEGYKNEILIKDLMCNETLDLEDCKSKQIFSKKTFFRPHILPSAANIPQKDHQKNQDYIKKKTVKKAVLYYPSSNNQHCIDAKKEIFKTPEYFQIDKEYQKHLNEKINKVINDQKLKKDDIGQGLRETKKQLQKLQIEKITKEFKNYQLQSIMQLKSIVDYLEPGQKEDQKIENFLRKLKGKAIEEMTHNLVLYQIKSTNELKNLTNFLHELRKD